MAPRRTCKINNRTVHNSFARKSSFAFVSDDDDDKDDAFHFVGYVPYKGKVYELDGLQSGFKRAIGIWVLGFFRVIL